jgi:hypothetical protein
MAGERYRLNTPTLAIMTLPNGRRVLVTIPKGADVKILAGPLNGTRLVNVGWEGEAVMMFAVDLVESGTLTRPL